MFIEAHSIQQDEKSCGESENRKSQSQYNLLFKNVSAASTEP
jgi:hypothetical protein